MRGKQEKTQELTPEAREQYQLAKQLAAIGTPMYRGPEIAAINQAELASRGNVNTMASALGLQGAGDLSIGAPTATQGGVTGYTTYQGGQAALDMLKKFEPGRYKALMDMMIDPITGEMPNFVSGSTPAVQAASAGSGGNGSSDDDNSNYQGIDYTNGNYDNNTYANKSTGNIASVGYGVGQVDPGLAKAAGYTSPMNTTAKSSFGADLTSSLTDSSYDPPGTVFSRTIDKLKTGLLG